MRAYATIQEAMTSGFGTERSFHCGNPDHSDRNASASVNSITGAFLCYSCGWKGKIDPENFEIDVAEAGRYIARLVEQLESEDRDKTESWLSRYDATGPGEYWLSRFDERTCKKFRLGMDYANNAATIPLRDLHGAPLGVVRRNLDPDKPKYQYPQNIDISKLLFNYHACNDDIIFLVEGASDAIAAWEAGHQAMALYGSRVSKAQRVALARYNPRALISVFDMDSAGENAARDVTAAFPEMFTDRPQWRGYKDLASMPLATRKALLGRLHNEMVNKLAQSRSTALGFDTCESPRQTPSRTAPLNSTPQSANTETLATPPPRLRLVRISPSPASLTS